MNKVSVYGGLGNQMFQYALCIALNQKDKKARISFSGYLYYHHHYGFDLYRAFKLMLPLQQKLLVILLSHGGFLYNNKLATFIFRRLISLYQRKRYLFYKEKKEFDFDNAVFLQESVFFIGTWQSVSYFKDIDPLIKQHFVFNIPTDIQNIKQIAMINNCNSVSIHIRRGDYLSKNWQNSHAVIKDETYYSRAIEYIKNKIEYPHYFIFSDDMDWVKENFKISDCTYVDNNKGKYSYLDMYLMSLCKHNIIANSTFSWWAAWLNKNEAKIVIMPDRWINNNSCVGIFSEDWIKLAV